MSVPRCLSARGLVLAAFGCFGPAAHERQLLPRGPNTAGGKVANLSRPDTAGTEMNKWPVSENAQAVVNVGFWSSSAQPIGLSAW